MIKFNFLRYTIVIIWDHVKYHDHPAVRYTRKRKGKDPVA
jgi:hypothetical protein